MVGGSHNIDPVVNILDPNQMMQLAQDTTKIGRYRLVNAVSQFFEQKDLTEKEKRLASEIMMSLINQAEMDLREALAERLSVLDNVPSEVIIFLAHEPISVAKPLLQHSPVLNDVDLLYIIAGKGEEYWRTIAGRDRLSPSVTARLIDTGDAKTGLALINNRRITLQRSNINKLIRASLKAEELQAPLLRRPEIDSDMAISLYVCVSETLRHEISRRFLTLPSTIEASLGALVEELTLEAKGSQQVTAEMVILARRFAERGEISPVIMIKTLRRGQISFFVALLAERLGLAPDVIVRLVQKEGGKPFAVVCRSTGMMKSEFASIFLLTRELSTGDKVVDQNELAAAIEYYDTLREFDAQRAVKDWIKNPETV